MFLRELKKFKKELDKYNKLLIYKESISSDCIINLINHIGIFNINKPFLHQSLPITPPLKFKPLCWTSKEYTYLEIYYEGEYIISYNNQYGENDDKSIRYLDNYELSMIYKYLCEKFERELKFRCTSSKCKEYKNIISEVEKFRQISEEFENRHKSNIVKLLSNMFYKLPEDILNNIDNTGIFINNPDCDGSGHLLSVFIDDDDWVLYFDDDSHAPLKDWDINLLVEVYYKFLSFFANSLSKKTFLKMNEMVSKPTETRLNYFKNFNHFNKDQEGGMEIFGPRSNNEIQRMNNEIFDEDEEDMENDDHELSTDIGDFDHNYPEDTTDGLTINSDQEVIQRQHSHPYGFGNTPSPTYKLGGHIQSKTGSPILKFEEFSWKGVSIKGKELDIDFINFITKDLPNGSKILDIGYGDGTEMEYLASKGYDVYGTEVKRDYETNLKNSKHITHDMRNKFPFKDNYFDLVYCRLSLHYFEEQEILNIMREINRICNKYFAFTCKTSDGGYKSGKKFYPLEKWEEMATESGFTVYHSEDKIGKLYGKDSTWVEVYTTKIQSY